MTSGAAGSYQLFPQLLDDLDMLRELHVTHFTDLVRTTVTITTG